MNNLVRRGSKKKYRGQIRGGISNGIKSFQTFPLSCHFHIGNKILR